MTYDDFARDAQTLNLNIVGICEVLPEGNLPSKYKSLVLLGPDVQTFWPHFINQLEYLDGGPDPLDRWSVRIISGWAETLKAKAVYPFNGPPYPPFYNWALRSGSCHRSPLHMLVHQRNGLLLSLRGALAVTEGSLDKPSLMPRPVTAALQNPACRPVRYPHLMRSVMMRTCARPISAQTTVPTV